MRVIVNRLESPWSNPRHEISCVQCKSILEVEPQDIKRKVTDHEGAAYVFECGACKREIWIACSVLDRKGIA